MADRTIEAVLRLSSKLGSMAAFDKTAAKLAQIDQKAKAFNRTQTVMGRTHAALGRSMAAVPIGKFLGGAAVAYGAKQAFTQFADTERRLTRIAINADAGKDALDGMFRTVNRAAQDYAMSQSDVTEGLEALVASGRSLDDALSFLPAVTATAQASGSAVADIATSADSVSASFDIAGDRMQAAFDILVAGGKMGKFELRDMASYLPSLAPAFTALGYKGEEGLQKLTAMLQVVRQRTGSSEEAATALSNIFQKMNSEETNKKFSKFGINLRKELTKARREGRDVLDVFLELSRQAIKGDMSKLPQLFTDAQFATGMRALLSAPGAVEEFVAALKKVDGATLKDLNQVLANAKADIDKMSNSWNQFVTRIGQKVAVGAVPALEYINQQLADRDDFEAGVAKEEARGGSRDELHKRLRDEWNRQNPDKASWLNPERERAIVAAIQKFGRSEIDNPYKYFEGLSKHQPRDGSIEQQQAEQRANRPPRAQILPEQVAVPPTRDQAEATDKADKARNDQYKQLAEAHQTMLQRASTWFNDRERLIKAAGAAAFPGGYVDDPRKEVVDIAVRERRLPAPVRDLPSDTRAEAIRDPNRVATGRPVDRIPGGQPFTGGFPSHDELVRAIADGSGSIEDAGTAAGESLEGAGSAVAQQLKDGAAAMAQAVAALLSVAAKLSNIKVNVQTVGGGGATGVRANVGQSLAGTGGRWAE